MNWVDYGIIAIIVLSALLGVMRGFIREVFGIGTWVLAIVLAVVFGAQAADALQAQVATPLLRAALAYGGLFLGGLLIGGILTAVLVARVRESRFSSTDRTLGTGVGLLRGVLVVGLIVLVAGTMGMNRETWWRESQLVDHGDVVAEGLRVVIPEAWLEPLKPDSPDPQAAPGTSLSPMVRDAAGKAMREAVEQQARELLPGAGPKGESLPASESPAPQGDPSTTVQNGAG